MDFGQKQNNVNSLKRLDEIRYENIFNVYNVDNYYFYNLLTTINVENLDSEEYYYLYRVNSPISWYNLSYKVYQTIHAWWIICVINNINNPTIFPENGSYIKILKREYVTDFVDQVINKTNG